MRVYIDKILVLDKWFDQAPTTYTVNRNLAPGRHRMEVQYYENGGGATAMLSWKSPPKILSPPSNQTVLEGSTVSFSVTASGTPNPAYQWRFNQTNNIPGAASSTLVLTNVALSDAGVYAVLVTNAAGAILSQGATLTVVPLSARPLLSARGLLSDGSFQMTFTGQTGWHYRIDATTDFSNWFILSDLDYTSGPVLFVDPQSTNFFPNRFYRAVVP